MKALILAVALALPPAHRPTRCDAMLVMCRAHESVCQTDPDECQRAIACWREYAAECKVRP